MAPQSILNQLRDKPSFHRIAKRQLRLLATALGLPRGHYDLRSNPAGPAIMGEITLHTENLYVQVGDRDILIRSCTSRKDYTGGPNGFLPLGILDSIPDLVTALVQRRLAVSPHHLRSVPNPDQRPVHPHSPVLDLGHDHPVLGAGD